MYAMVSDHQALGQEKLTIVRHLQDKSSLPFLKSQIISLQWKSKLQSYCKYYRLFLVFRHLLWTQLWFHSELKTTLLLKIVVLPCKYIDEPSLGSSRSCELAPGCMHATADVRAGADWEGRADGTHGGHRVQLVTVAGCETSGSRPSSDWAAGSVPALSALSSSLPCTGRAVCPICPTHCELLLS